jgi:D-amino-acid dehydrogenase
MGKSVAMHVVIIGAGIIGSAAAHALLDAGCEVTIVDREGPVAGTSQGNAGWIAFGDVAPLASAETLRKVPTYLSDPLGPLSIRPGHVPFMLPWFLRFLWASRPSAVKSTTEALISLQSRVLPAWNALARTADVERLIHRRGALYVFDEEGPFERAAATLTRRREAGIRVDAIPAEEMRQMEPNLAEGLAGAIYHADAAHVSDPREITRAIFDAAIGRGANFVRGAVTALSAADTGAIAAFENGRSLEAGAIVLAAGVWSKKLAATLGDSVSLESERGYNVSFPGAQGQVSRPVNIMGHGFVVTPLESGLRIGGAVEFAGLDTPPNHKRTRALYDKAARFLRELPAFETGNLWMGHRPSTPDSLPVIGPSRATPKVVYAFGHGHYGLTQSAITAEAVAALVLDRKPGFELAPFSAQRF